MSEPRVNITDSTVKARGLSEISKPELAPDVVDFISKSSQEGLTDAAYFVKLADQLSNGAPVFEKPIKKGELSGKYAHFEGFLVANKRINSIQLLRLDKVNAEFRALFKDDELHVAYGDEKKPGLVSAKYKDGKAFEAECNVHLSHEHTLNIKASFYSPSDTFITGGKALDEAVIKTEEDKKLLSEGKLLKDAPIQTLVLPDGVKMPLHNVNKFILELNLPNDVEQALQLWGGAQLPSPTLNKSFTRI